jgi:hypothetical protein
VLPAFVLWDGIVSALRVYGVDELRELVQGLDGYDWDIRRVRLGAAPAHATVLVGVPRSTDPAPVPEPVTG